MRKLALAALVVLFLASVADARPRLFKRRGRGVTVRVGGAEVWGAAETDQQKCEAEAAYMFKFNIRGHVGPLIGHYEGCGWSGPGCATCVPRGDMRLTGDAQVGNYRVRSWRW